MTEESHRSKITWGGAIFAGDGPMEDLPPVRSRIGLGGCCSAEESNEQYALGMKIKMGGMKITKCRRCSDYIHL